MSRLRPGDRVAFEALPGCWITAVVVAVRGDGMAEVERSGGAERWCLPSRASRDKGARAEREIVALHRDLAIHAERVPLSGAAGYQGNGADVDVYAFGRDAAPLVGEVKARASGEGFAMLDRWLGDNDLLFLRRDRAEPLVLLPWPIWARLLGAAGKNAQGSPQTSVTRDPAPTTGDAPSANREKSLLPGTHAVVQDTGDALRLVLFDDTGENGGVALDAARAVRLAGELIEAASRRLR